MPTYAYACQKCDHEFETFQSITARPLRKCPACGQAALKRLIGTGAGIIFKGSGFYATDYRSDGYKKAAERDTGVKKKTGDKKESKTETVAAPAAGDTKSAAEKKKSA